MKQRLKKAQGGTQVIPFSFLELEQLDLELEVITPYTRHPEKARLVAVQKRVDDLLNALIDSPHGNGLQRERPVERANVIFQFKIYLRAITPTIWRRIQTEDCTLEDLHECIQIAMGWENFHLHIFTIDGQDFGPVNDETDSYGEWIDESEMMLSELLPTSAERIRWMYEYDFGDSWKHEMVFEGYAAKQKETVYPLCLEGARACPCEDSGGPWGYDRFLEETAKYGRFRAQNPNADDEGDEEEGYKPFDPEWFDVDEVNGNLRDQMT